MQIVMIHGQNHRGSTYRIGKMVADAAGRNGDGILSATGFWLVLCWMQQLLYERRKPMSAPCKAETDHRCHG